MSAAPGSRKSRSAQVDGRGEHRQPNRRVVQSQGQAPRQERLPDASRHDHSRPPQGTLTRSPRRMNLSPHTAPKMARAPRYRHKVASFRKNSMERVDVTLEEYNGLDLLNLSITRDSSGRHSLNRMRGTALYISLQ